MELLQLTYFCDAAQSENFSKTAKKYNVPPSNISQTIRRLEKELDTALFYRTANKVTLTESGKMFYAKISAALDLIRDAKSELVNVGDEPTGEIKILIGTNRRVVTEAIEAFKQKYPRVGFLINHVKRDSDQKYDFIVTDTLQGESAYKNQPVLTEEMVLACRNDHPLATREKINLSDLSEERFISMSAGTCLYSTMLRICADAGFLPRVAIQTDDPYYVRKYLEMGLGIALVPSVSWKGQYAENIVTRSVGGYMRNTYVLFKDHTFMSRAKTLFFEALVEAFRQAGML